MTASCGATSASSYVTMGLLSTALPLRRYQPSPRASSGPRSSAEQPFAAPALRTGAITTPETAPSMTFIRRTRCRRDPCRSPQGPHGVLLHLRGARRAAGRVGGGAAVTPQCFVCAVAETAAQKVLRFQLRITSGSRKTSAGGIYLCQRCWQETHHFRGRRGPRRGRAVRPQLSVAGAIPSMETGRAA